MKNALRSDGQTPTITCFLMVERWFFSHHHSQYFVEVFTFHFHRICLLNLPHYGGCQPKHDWFCPSKPFWRNTFHKKMSNPSISLFPIFLYKKNTSICETIAMHCYIPMHMRISATERLTMYMLVMVCICLLDNTATSTRRFPLTPTWLQIWNFHHHPWQLPGIVREAII